MRLGLIGTGKQGQRYLLEKNGGRHIKVSGSRRIPLDDVDGVIIATHPAGHKELALECIAAGKAVLIEKPLALNLRDCEEILDAAERASVPCEVAHTHLWSESWDPPGTINFVGSGHVQYTEHKRDYSPWLDWAPHLIALLASRIDYTERKLRSSVSVTRAPVRLFDVAVGSGKSRYHYDGINHGTHTPMWHMVEEFVAQPPKQYEFNRRVYRALFAED